MAQPVDPFYGKLKDHPTIRSIASQGFRNAQKTKDWYKEFYLATMAAYTAGMLEGALQEPSVQGKIEEKIKRIGD